MLTFFDPAEFPFLLPLAREWQVIAAEVSACLPEAMVFPDPQTELLDEGGSWQKLLLLAWGLDIPHNLRLMPRTAALLKSTPRLMQAAIYILGPSSHIAPHRGISGKVLRAHLGLRCPQGCQLRVGEDVRSEADGTLLVFDDMHEHEAWNRSDEARLVLHLDFFRPEIALDAALDEWVRELRVWLIERSPEVVPHLLRAGVEIDEEDR